FTELHRCLFEDAPIPSHSVDIAFAIMVLEHLPEPHRFWDKLYDTLKEGGIFWGLTVDARHWFSTVSLWMDTLRVKDIYLRWSLGASSEQSYESYPVYYRSNTPTDLERYTRRFRSRDFVGLSRRGQLHGYLPPSLRSISDWLTRLPTSRRTQG